MSVSGPISSIGAPIGTVICINTGGYDNITLGERYEASYRVVFDSKRTLDDTYWITDDSGDVRAVYRSHFITLSEWRDNKLKSIGI